MTTADYQTQFDRFTKDVEGHTITVLRDDGLYRHLHCAKPGTYCMSFDVITWPGHLAYCGDMGDFVFSRLKDMFEFFRGRQTAMIDRGYLAEKCVAADKADGLQAFSAELFKAAVREDFDMFTEDWDEGDKAELWQIVEDEVLTASGDGLSAALQATMAFEYKNRQVFTDFWDHRLEEYTTRFWWCCYAVPWAIAQYDAAKVDAAAGEKVTG